VKNQLILFVFLINTYNTYCQNLVINPDFQDTVLCPSSYNANLYLSDWIFKGSGIGYFNSCSNNYGVPQNLISYQQALNNQG